MFWGGFWGWWFVDVVFMGGAGGVVA